jgi:hypothetical protein
MAAHVTPNTVVQVRLIQFHQVGSLMDKPFRLCVVQLAQARSVNEIEQMAIYRHLRKTNAMR